MRKVSSKNVNWLKAELGTLEKEGVLDASVTARVQRYYAEQTTSVGGAAWAVTLFSILGALLIGGGIILLFAHNWDELSRNTRAVLSFVPLILASILSFVAVTKQGGTALRESAGLFHALAIGAAIALIGQTYHLPSNVPGFLMIWALLAAPLMFLLRSSMVTLVYLGLLTGWCGIAQNEYGHAQGFWLLLLPPLIHTGLQLRRDRHAPVSLLLLFALVLCFLSCLGVVFERTVPGLWTMAYASLLSTFYLLGLNLYKDEEGWDNPLKLVGIIGIAILAYLFTWTHFWDDIGWGYCRNGWRYQTWGIWVDSGITLGLLVVWAGTALVAVRKRSVEAIALALFPLITALCFLLASVTPVYEITNALIFNVYFFFLGLLYVTLGCRDLTLRKLNGGMFLISILIVTRFFDDEFGFMARGIAFIFLGLCFLVANVVIARKKKGVEA